MSEAEHTLEETRNLRARSAAQAAAERLTVMPTGVLKIRIDSGFDVFYLIGNLFGLASFGAIQQGDAGAISGGVAHRVNIFKLAIRYQS